MTGPLNYPLAQVLDIKKRRVDEAKKVVREKIKLLEREREKLLEAEKQRDKAKDHQQAKLQQLRDYVDTDGLNPEKVLQMKVYLKIVKEKLAAEEQKVLKQKDNVQTAEKNLDEAKEQKRQREYEVDKIKMHREEWEKEARKEIELQEIKEMDELGNLMFLKKQRDAKEIS
ncbi:MAG: hypothetical protein ACI8RA_001422 [Chlamydiales bacterium]|jgi:hypothetical protein